MQTISTACQKCLLAAITQVKLDGTAERKFKHCSPETAYPWAKKLVRWKKSGNIAVLAQTSTDTINHQLRDPYHLWHSQLQLTTLICPQHYSTVILNYKRHNSSCSCLTCSPGKKKKKKLAVSSRQKVHTDFFVHSSCHIIVCCSSKQSRKLIKLLCCF